MIGQTVSHYRILEHLGEGGMGVVYKALDTHLDRPVALKFLPPHLGTDKDARSRFIQEAKSASSLDHTNICTIHDIDETDDGRLFISMSCYEGESLKDKIERGPLPIEEAVDYAIQIAQGLSLPNEAGIIHRDIKPGNVMITPRGVIKIVDFGLAKMVETSLTKMGTTLGTAMYMSPEQARGEKVDYRTDIWSLGVILYEMLSGKQPFRADYDAALLYQVVNEEPESLRSLRENTPNTVLGVVDKCLEKEPVNRYGSILEIVDALSDLSSLTSKPEPKKSIIVLPFVNMSPDPDQEYFSDGLTEEIITDLSHVGDLQVISRNSAMTFKGTKKKTREIARDVNVTYVLEGSVRKAGNNLRITAQLIDATTDAHLWAEKYRGTLDDVFDIQENVSRSIVDALKLTLSPTENKEISARPIDNIQALECYHRARHAIFQFKEESLDHALLLIKNGLDLIGENEPLYAAMGSAYWQYLNMGIKKETALREIEACTNEIFKLNPESSHGKRLQGIINYRKGNANGVVIHMKKVLDTDRNDPEALLFLIVVYLNAGKSSNAMPLVDRLLRIEPVNSINQSMLGYKYWMDGEFESALSVFQKVYRLDPDNTAIRFLYAMHLALNDRLSEFNSLIDRLVQDTSNIVFTWIGTLLRHALHNQKSNALQSVSKELIETAREDESLSWWMAECYALLDEKHEALDWLENAVNRGVVNYPILSEYDPFLENIRSEPRFKQLMERVKYEWEHFEV